MEQSVIFFAVAIPAVLFAGISKGGFGAAAAFAATPILALILEPTQALALMLPLLIVMDFASLPPYWRKWNNHAAILLILGGIPGAFWGAALIRTADPDVFRLLIGLIALGFVAFQIGAARGWFNAARPISNRGGILFGIGTGFTSFISHAGGPVASIYLLSKGLTKIEYQATTVIVFWASNLIKIVLYFWLGIATWDIAAASLYLLPVAIAGTFLGVYLHRIVPERLFFALVYLFLTLAGAKLILDALN